MLCTKIGLRACGFLAIVAVLAAGSARADIVGAYVDATPSNTAISENIVTSGGENDNDNLWFQRSESCANDGSLLTSGGSFEDAPMLTTTATGVPNGAYGVYVVYWTNDSDASKNWNVQAAIAGNSLATCDQSNGLLTGNVRSDGHSVQRQAYLGAVTVTDGTLSVNIDDWNGTRPVADGMDCRSWYDGISYGQPVPEPTSCMLLMTAMTAILAYAWRKRG